MPRTKQGNKPKSGFMEGRSVSSGSSTSSSKVSKKKQKLSKARNDLAEVLNDLAKGKEGKDVLNASQTFENDLRLLRRSVIKSGESFNADSANRTLLKTMLAMNLKLVPIANKAYKRSKKENAMYALLAIEKQVLELATELKLLGNVEHQSEFIETRIINPIFMAMVQINIKEFLDLKNSIDSLLPPKQARNVKLRIDDALKNVTAYMDESSHKLHSDITSYLSGDVDFLNKDSGDSGRGGKKKKKKR